MTYQQKKGRNPGNRKRKRKLNTHPSFFNKAKTPSPTPTPSCGKYIPDRNKITLCFWNSQSVRLKTQVIKDFRLEHDIDIYLLAETWLTETNHTQIITELKDNTCNFINYPRPFDQSGGGLGVIYKKQLNVTRAIPPINTTTMQVLEITLTMYSKKYSIVSIGGVIVKKATHVRNLGVVFDEA